MGKESQKGKERCVEEWEVYTRECIIHSIGLYKHRVCSCIYMYFYRDELKNLMYHNT